MLKTLSIAIADLLYPPGCPGCGGRREEPFICAACKSTLQLAGEVLLTSEIIPQCLPPIVLWRFQENEPIQRVMHRLKYANSPWLGTDIGELLGAALLEADTEKPALILPVPLHHSRYLERGYNQSEWIAVGVSRRIGAPMDAGCLSRQRATASQTSLSREERLVNTKGAFAVKSGRIQGCTVAVVDDTVTTGATLMECARALVDAGAESVLPLAAAAAPLRMVQEHEVTIPVIPG